MPPEDAPVLVPTLAAVDIGSNSIKLTVARLPAPGLLHEIHSDVETVRLGANLVDDGLLDPDRAERALACLERFHHRAALLGSQAFFGVATEALRRARDGQAFLHRIEVETGWMVKIITGTEEARLTYEGLRTLVEHDNVAVIGDIGGGSTELIWTRRGSLLAARSIPIGSGRLTDEGVTGDPPTPEELAASRRTAATVVRAGVADIAAEPSPIDRLLISGGTGVYLSVLIGQQDDIGDEDLERASAALTSLPAADLAAQLGIALERARVLPAGVMVVAALKSMFRPTVLATTESGLRRGLLLEAYRRPATP